MLKIVVKVIVVFIISLLAISLYNAEVVEAPIGLTPKEYNDRLKAEGKPGRYILRSGGDIALIERDNKRLSILYLFVAGLLLVWAWNDWRHR